MESVVYIYSVTGQKRLRTENPSTEFPALNGLIKVLIRFWDLSLASIVFKSYNYIGICHIPKGKHTRTIHYFNTLC